MIFPFRYMWRRSDIDFINFNWYEFEKFQNVMTVADVSAVIVDSLSPFSISANFSNVLSDGIYDYCFGKLINLKDSERWSHNFSGEIKIYLLEKARYLQAYDRDINSNISTGDSSKTVTNGEGVSGSADTRKTGNVKNSQITNVDGSDTQRGEKSLNSSLTTLFNRSTSTNYLGTQNEEAGESGSISQEGTQRFGKSNQNDIDLGMQNGASLSKNIASGDSETTSKKSPLTVAKEESAFSFQEFFEPLFEILDSYFTNGGQDYA